MGFLNNIFSSASTKNNSTKDYVDLGDGLPWFTEYRDKGKPELSKFFGLEKTNQIKIKATIGKTGYYQTPEGKRWVVIASYFDINKQQEFIFYCPEWEYDPIEEYSEGENINMYVDKNDYSKYEMPIY